MLVKMFMYIISMARKSQNIFEYGSRATRLKLEKCVMKCNENDVKIEKKTIYSISIKKRKKITQLRDLN